MLEQLISDKKYQEAYLKLILLHPHDQAKFIASLDDEDKKQILEFYDDNELSKIMSYLDEDFAVRLLTKFDIDKQISIIKEMDIDDAVRLIDELPDLEQKEILNVVDDQNSLEKLLDYDVLEIGFLMTSKFVKIDSTLNVKEAMKILIEQAPEVESIGTIFVVNNNKYLGTLSLNQLIKAKGNVLINDLYKETPFVFDNDDIEYSINQMREYNLYEIAVCNEYDNLVGIVTLDDAIEEFERLSKENFARLSAIKEFKEKNIFKAALHRLPWLIILLLTSIPIALSAARFEEIILAVSLLALFQPLILDASGDVATQTLAVTLRDLSYNNKANFKEGFKEVVSGMISGFILALAASIITYFLAISFKMEEPMMVSLLIALSLFITITLGPIVGFIIPVFLNKIKIDPAVASGPFITTIVDLSSLFIYFGLATLMLGGL
ncbi:magnesium transporter [Haploplasma modicum]|jgi:magnesium transporter|uniref:magnesium transporter n=1 Tax=Haploplasma modicum TaxID=2150 RepID=UPI00214B262C|nr:magnesium transporter [Haploplasma modicum]MCR1809039.1 magnesium transporter [Haploplasma modicum]